MTRPLGMFPYSPDGTAATYSDGIVASGQDPRTSVFMPSPTGGVGQLQYNPYEVGQKGIMVPGGIGNTDYVYCNQIWYQMQAGDFS